MTELRQLALTAARSRLGVSATVIMPGCAAVQATVVPLPSSSEFPSGAELALTQRRRLFGLSRAEIPNVPRGTIIQVAGVDYTVHSTVVEDGDDVRVLVH